MVPNTIFWIEEADNMHGVHKGRPALATGCGRERKWTARAALFGYFTENSLIKAPAWA